MTEEKIYAVQGSEGLQICESEDKAKELIKGNLKLKLKTFEGLSQLKLYDLSSRIDGEQGLNVEHEVIKDDSYIIWSDGSQNKETGLIRFGYLISCGDKILHEASGEVPYCDEYSANNILGECYAVTDALTYCVSNNLTDKNIVVAHDYIGLKYWMSGEWKRKSDVSKKFYEEVKSFQKELNISFFNIPGHSVHFSMNEKADKLARMGSKS